MSALSKKAPRHKAFMLHMWEERLEQVGQSSAWRFRLEDPHSGKVHTFADLNGVMSFLQTEVKIKGAVEPSSGQAGLMQRLQRKILPLSDVELGGASAGSAEPEPPDLDRAQDDGTRSNDQNP